ncbi:MAG: four helix bundle protein [Desulfobacteraceae bacterium 4484_190.2]|nr:MAG: four helix bundle protein [Desulfobacteraceae bacterium 4484_190.2]
MAYRSFEDLDVWKRGFRIAVRIYEVLKDCRDYGLKDQMTRSAVSIASNISKGAERDSLAEYIRFLHIAKGSAAELRTQVYIAQQIGVISHEIKNELIKELKIISSMLHALIKSLKLKSFIKTCQKLLS